MWLPSYFCMDVAHSLRTKFDLVWYRDLPNEAVPDHKSLNPLPGDLVLAVNFFGIKNGLFWNDWLTRYDDVCLVEDHTHDPFSTWAKKSKASYCFASLRKTLPIPDGSIIWSPRNLPLPTPSGDVPTGSYLKLQAMILKSLYLRGTRISKETFRNLQIQGETSLTTDSYCQPSEFTQLIFKHLPVFKFRKERRRNIQLFEKLMSSIDHEEFRSLTNCQRSDNTVPFNGLLICKSEEIRDKLLEHLISQQIYATVHWRINSDITKPVDPTSKNLSSRLITIPLDHRYKEMDICKIFYLLTSFLQLFPSQR